MRKRKRSIIKSLGETNRLSKIVNSILSFSKIEAGKRKYNFDQVDLNSIAVEALSTFEAQLKRDNFEYSFKIDESIPKIHADQEAISEAVVNLIDNAIKYSTENKKIMIKTGTEKNSVFIEISDSGLGISSEDQSKIFDKFFRVSTGNVHNIKGTGLGLTLVKHIMDAHKGEVQIISKLGQGSTFRLKFFN